MDVITSVLCLLYRQPGPLSVTIEHNKFQLYPINRRLCPEIDASRDTIFELYTRKNPRSPQILNPYVENPVTAYNINFSNPTVVFVHGYLETSRSDDAIQMRDKYLQLGDHNVILIDSGRLLAGPYYLTSALNCLPIGQYSAKLIDSLVNMGMQLEDLHIIGMSLGSHIAGIIGKYVTTGQVSRITGLDPAGPYFSLVSAKNKIGKGDAKFVDIVHTNAGRFGLKEKLGHVDIWVNEGSRQPACHFLNIIKRAPGSLSELVFCNHYQSYRMYVQSLIDPKSYPITKCSNFADFKKGKCNSNEKTYLGIGINTTARGDYYIETGVTAADL